MTLPFDSEQHAPYTATLMSEQVKGPVTQDFALKIPDNEIFGLNNFQLISLITILCYRLSLLALRFRIQKEIQIRKNLQCNSIKLKPFHYFSQL